MELAKYNFRNGEDALSGADPLEKLAFFLSRAAEFEAAELKRMLPEPIFQKAIGVLEMISHTPEQRMRYEARRKAEMDYEAAMAETLEIGLHKGRLEGRQEGELKGMKRGLVAQIRLLQGLLKEPVSPESELLEMDFEPLSRFCDTLKERMHISE